MELYQPGAMLSSLKKTNDCAEPGFAGGGRETGTGYQSWTEAISGSQVIAGLLTSGNFQCFTRALQWKAARFWPAHCAFSSPSPQSSGSTHSYRVSHLLSSLAQSVAFCCFMSRFAGKEERSFYTWCTQSTSIGAVVPQSDKRQGHSALFKAYKHKI